MAELLVSGKDTSHSFHFSLETTRTWIGRDPQCHLTLHGPELSRKHAEIIYRDGSYYLKNLGKNGTRLNEKKVAFEKLSEGDQILLGAWKIIFTQLPKEPMEKTITSQKHAPSHAAFHHGETGMIGSCPETEKWRTLVRKVATSSFTALIIGESGVGKEVTARALHGLSAQPLAPFVAINCAALPHSLIESELFGHEKGSFTGAETAKKGAFEQAGTGTLFLDEIGELSLEAQAKILRVLENRTITRVGDRKEIEVPCRVVTATHRNLAKMVREGQFRSDLYYRLYVMPIEIPPLRKRREDIPELAAYFLQQMNQEKPLTLSPEALAKLREHLWPGNVRELKNVLIRASLLASGNTLTEKEIEFLPQLFMDPESGENTAAEPKTLEEMEKQFIIKTIRRLDGNKTAAAQELGIAVSTMFRKIRELGIE